MKLKVILGAIAMIVLVGSAGRVALLMKDHFVGEGVRQCQLAANLEVKRLNEEVRTANNRATEAELKAENAQKSASEEALVAIAEEVERVRKAALEAAAKGYKCPASSCTITAREAEAISKIAPAGIGGGK